MIHFTAANDITNSAPQIYIADHDTYGFRPQWKRFYTLMDQWFDTSKKCDMLKLVNTEVRPQEWVSLSCAHPQWVISKYQLKRNIYKINQ